MAFDVKTRLSRLTSSAKARNIHVNLDVNKYQNLINCGCFYCGISLQKENGYCLDRVDSSEGYILSNVVACCKRCNMAKSDMHLMDFVGWLERAYKHTKKTMDTVQAQLDSNKHYSFDDEIKLHAEINQGKTKHRVKYVPES